VSRRKRYSDVEPDESAPPRDELGEFIDSRIKAHEAAKPKTVRVRIAVAVDPSGFWQSAGGHEAGEDWRDLSLEYLSNIEAADYTKAHVVCVTADVPLPVTPTVEGTVSQ
jgi:hypothetical protein